MKETDLKTRCTRCRCCGSDAPAQKCGYCGFLNTFSLSPSDEERIEQRAAEYRGERIRQIGDFSVRVRHYEPAEPGAEPKEWAGSIRLCRGADCDRKICWSREAFAQNLDPDLRERPLTITYTVGGQKKSLEAAMKLVSCGEYWRLGLEITEDLRLMVYLGTEENHTKSGPYDLKLL